MPPASNGNPPYKGRSEELTTNIADFCNKIGTKRSQNPAWSFQPLKSDAWVDDGLRLAATIGDRWPPIHLIVATGEPHPLNSELASGGLFVSKPYRPDQIHRA